MLRYVAALVLLLTPLALADSVDPSRDANLAQFDGFCLLVSISSSEGTAISPSDLKATVESNTLDKALLYSVPVKAASDSKCFIGLHPYLLVTAILVPKGLAESIQVVLQSHVSTYDLPTVWENSAILAGNTVTSDEVKSRLLSLFDDFALAWKKQHAR